MYRQMMRWGAALAAVGIQTAAGAWMNLVADDFSAAPTNWTYAGVSNVSNEALFRHDAVNERIAAEWDQSNHFTGSPNDPYVIINSYLARPLPRVLTDRHSFRIRAVLRIESNTIPDTTEFYQIANIGLYGLAHMGPDRTLADNWSGNATLLRNGSDFVEFNYFINNESFGFNPNIGALIAAHVDDNFSYAYYTGSGFDTNWFHDTDMGADQYLPVNTNLFLELFYHGGATDAVSRRASVALYTDAARTNLVEVNGVSMYYWTRPLPTDETFELTHVAFANYGMPNWGGPNAEGAGAWDDVSVDWAVSDGQILHAAHATDPHLTWAAVSGRTYAVVASADLISGTPVTQALVTADFEVAGWTNPTPAALQFLYVEPLGP